MNCAEFSEDIQAGIDGELPEPRRRDLEAHLAACPSCRGREGLRRGLRAALPKVPPPVSADFTDRVMAGIRREEERPWLELLLGARPLLRAAAFAAVLLIVGGLMMGRRMGGGPRAERALAPTDRCLAVNCRA